MRLNLPVLVAAAVAAILLGGFLFAGEPLWLFLFGLYVLSAVLVNPWLFGASVALAIVSFWFWRQFRRRTAKR